MGIDSRPPVQGDDDPVHTPHRPNMLNPYSDRNLVPRQATSSQHFG